MQDNDSSPIIPFQVASNSDLIQQLLTANQQLLTANQQLHQTIDELVNAIAIQKELIQKLRDEIAILKGQKPKPKIPPSKLEGPNSKLDWRKRIGPNNNRNCS